LFFELGEGIAQRDRWTDDSGAQYITRLPQLRAA